MDRLILHYNTKLDLVKLAVFNASSTIQTENCVNISTQTLELHG